MISCFVALLWVTKTRMLQSTSCHPKEGLLINGQNFSDYSSIIMMFSPADFMFFAVTEAKKALALNEVPVGAIVVKDKKVIVAGFNSVLRDQSVTAHAEINAINAASKGINNYRLVNCDLYVTLEPCHMCAKAIVDARIDNIYFSTLEPKTGSIVSVDNFFDKKFLNHRVNYVSGLMQDESSRLLKDFFRSRR